LKEVWEELDGLDPNRFNPKTFFILHGKVGHVSQTQAEMKAVTILGPKYQEDIPVLMGLS
jgi:hypothetical protein